METAVRLILIIIIIPWFKIVRNLSLWFLCWLFLSDSNFFVKNILWLHLNPSFLSLIKYIPAILSIFHYSHLCLFLISSVQSFIGDIMLSIFILRIFSLVFVFVWFFFLDLLELWFLLLWLFLLNLFFHSLSNNKLVGSKAVACEIYMQDN